MLLLLHKITKITFVKNSRSLTFLIFLANIFCLQRFATARQVTRVFCVSTYRLAVRAMSSIRSTHLLYSSSELLTSLQRIDASRKLWLCNLELPSPVIMRFWVLSGQKIANEGTAYLGDY